MKRSARFRVRSRGARDNEDHGLEDCTSCKVRTVKAAGKSRGEAGILPAECCKAANSDSAQVIVTPCFGHEICSGRRKTLALVSKSYRPLAKPTRVAHTRILAITVGDHVKLPEPDMPRP